MLSAGQITGILINFSHSHCHRIHLGDRPGVPFCLQQVTPYLALTWFLVKFAKELFGQ